MSYLKNVHQALENIDQDQNLHQAAQAMAVAFENKKKIFTFGTGHSHMFGEELYARAGGWNYITPMLLDELTLSSDPFKSTYIERVAEFANVLLKLFPVAKNDVIIITSNSGRNDLIVEMALRAKTIGATVIAVTSLQHSQSITSRHASAKKLMDIADIVLDNHAPIGDATLMVKNGKVGPISTITNIFIAHLLVNKTLKILDQKQIKYDVLVSSNLDDQDQRNETLMRQK